MLRRVELLIFLNFALVGYVISQDIKENISYVVDRNIKLNVVQRNYTCDIPNCPITQGVCYENFCYCNYGYSTFINEGEQEINCNYFKKYRWIAFMLEFLFPFGIGHFYAGKTYLGIEKLILSLSLCSCWCGGILLSCMGVNSKGNILCAASCALCVAVTWTVFYLTDLICYISGFYLDGNGQELI
jgi:hypothetical protein